MRLGLAGVAIAATLILGAGCGDDTVDLDGAVPQPDANGDDFGLNSDGGAGLRSVFTMVGCAKLDTSGDTPVCDGSAPLRLTFVPLTTGVTMFLWTFNGGDPMTSKAITPSVLFARPGKYTVTLAAGGSAGTTQASGTVVVTPGGAGSSCSDDNDCDTAAGLSCLCGSNMTCPGGLASGVCTRDCGGTVCGANQVCVDVSRGLSAPMSLTDGGVADAGASQPWRRPLCLPVCSTSDDCRPGLYCRDVPALAPGASAGGPYAWFRACFADVLGDIGQSCLAATGDPDPSSCLSGRCDPLGARGLCTADCSSLACPTSDACAAFNGSPSSKLCLRRCDAAHPCSDPLLACEPPSQSGAYGFTVPTSEPSGATYCAPKKCSAPSDCAPAGTCAAGYCTRS
jgi:PKD repeat protein